MAILNGFLLPNPQILNGETGVAGALSEMSAPAPFDVIRAGLPLAGLISDETPVDLEARELSGFLLPSFGSVFFNRIHVLPSTKINVGNLANRQVRTIEIFNAFISETQTLEEVTTGGNLSGVSFDIGALPLDFPPLSSKFAELTINTTGTPAFDGFYNFIFAATDAPPLFVLGQRIIPFLFPHNWNELPVEALEYLTKIYETRADYETAVKMRPFPRRRLKYRHTVIESVFLADIAENRAELESVLYSWLDRAFALPIWEDLLVLSNQLPSGSETIAGSTVGIDFDGGAYVLLWNNSREYELIEIETVAANMISLARPTEFDWNAGTLVLPARLARLAGEISLVGETEEDLEFQTEWIVEPSARSINRVGSYAAPLYRGFPVYLPAYRFNDAIEHNLARKATVFDYQTGNRASITTGANARGAFQKSALNMNREEIAAFYGFLEARAGRLNPCWFPSWARDFRVVQTAGALASAISIAGNRFSSIYAADTKKMNNRRDLLIRWKTGEMFFCRVEGATAIDAESESVFIDTPLPRLLSPENFDRISFLKFARFDSDRIELTKETTNVSRAEFGLRELVAAE